MNDEVFLFLTSIILGLVGYSLFTFGAWNVKNEAFERGYMVECLGKSGYYWDCEE